MKQTIQVWVEDQPGVLLRVAGVITAKGANIESLSVKPNPVDRGTSYMVVVADIEPRLSVRVVNEINRLVQVLLAVDASGPAA